MPKTALFSPAQPRRAETRRSAASFSVACRAATYPLGNELLWQHEVGG